MSSSPSRWNRATMGALLLACGSLACVEDPYEHLKPENTSLGAVDPVTFPAENLGSAGNRMQAGSGTFTEAAAWVAGEAIGYFAYPMKTMAPRDPLRLLDDNKPYATVPTVYAFENTDEVTVPDRNRCSPPQGYRASKRLDPAPGWFTRQGNIFTALPTATYNQGAASASSYIPVVAPARANSNGRVCQDLKSEKGLSTALNGRLPKPLADRFLAWLIIDPAAAVYTFDDSQENLATSIAVQKWGWYNRYVLAYLDGGYIPTAETQIPANPMEPMGATKPILRMVPQKLYFPRSRIAVTDPDTMEVAMVMGRIGIGYDVLAARRGAEGYSPLCEVSSYDPAPPAPPPVMGMPPTMPPPVPEEMLPKDAAAVEMMFGPTIMPATPRYVFCLQVR